MNLANSFVNSSVDTAETVYTASKETVIDSFTASNTSKTNASYKAYIVSAGGDEIPQVPFKIVVWGENDLGIGLVSQTIPAGGSLMVECSALSSIYFTVSGRQIS